jgi:hypothetical protein
MAADDPPAGFSLRRWSRRKLEAARAASPAPAPPEPAGSPEVPAAPAAAVPAASPPGVAAAAAAPPLPPVESLVFDSDFTPFLRPEVDATVRRAALKKLFSDPRFNVMDRLDTYIDDYSLPDPIPPEMFKQLLHARSIFFPTKTRINADGHVEDVPPEEADAKVGPDATTEAARAAQAAASPTATLPPPDAAGALPPVSVAGTQGEPASPDGADIPPRTDHPTPR